MSLPVINTPTYELVVPSTKEKLVYRPFLVKEEKILLIAMEDGNEDNIIRAVRQIVTNCTFEKINASEIPMFDLEYIFLRIRAKSVGEVSTVNLLCPDDEKTYVKVDIPLEEVEVKFAKEHTKEISLTDEIMVQMKYPTFEMVQKLGDANAGQVFTLVSQCVERIYDGEQIHERGDFTQKDLETFLDSLNTKQFESIQQFFSTMPKLSHEVKFTNPETKKKHKITLEGMQSFFA
tara:strand:+ start:79 stop:780 length:702 start_codon:yes stop_codon:yes gene_type:complete